MARLERWLPLLLFFVALIVRLGTIWLTRFDGLYGQDPFAYYDYSLRLHAALIAGQVPPPFFWPIGYPLLVAAVMTLVGNQPLAAQLISIFAGAFIAPLVYLLVHDIRPGARLGGLVAGLLAAVSAQLLLSSVSVMADAAALLWATLSAWAMARYWRGLRLSWLTLAAATLAFATLTRWVYGLLVLPWGISAWLACREGKLPWREVAIAGGVAITVGLLILGAHFAPDLGREGISYAGDIEVYSWNPANALKRVVSNPDGTFTYERPIGLFYASPALHPAYIFPLFSPFLLLGLWSVWPRHRTIAALPYSRVALLAGWPLSVYLFLAGVTWQNWRFPLSFFPPLLILAGLGLDWLWPKVPVRYQPVLLIGLTLGLLGSLAWSIRDVGRFTDWKNAQLLVANEVNTQLPADATLLAFEITLTLQHYTDVHTVEFFTQDESTIAALLASAQPLYLLLNIDNVKTQWIGKSPSINYQWLEEHAVLLEIGHYNPYTLFRVEERRE